MSATLINKAQYRAAMDGEFEVFTNYNQHPLDHLLDIHNNTILHIHLNSSAPRSRNFAQKVLGKCPGLLKQANNAGEIPLHIAASHGHLEMVEMLIEQSTKVRDLETGSEEESAQLMLRMVNKQGETALHLAIKSDCFAVVREILKHEDPKYVYIANKFGETPLFLAADKRRVDIAVEILNKFELPEPGGPEGLTAFHVAIYHSFNHDVYHSSFSSRHDDLFELLNKLGSLVSQADETGWTPLHYAAYIGHHKLVSKILARDKSLAYAADKERNRTPLHLASCRGFVRVMEAIIEECPDCCAITDVKGWNALHYAVFSSYEGAIKVIMKNPSLVYLFNSQDIKGYTHLHLIKVSPKKYRSVVAWIYNGESGLQSQIFQDQLWSISESSRSPLKHSLYNEFSDRIKEQQLEEWIKDLGRDPFGDTIEEWKGWHQKRKETEDTIIPQLENAKDSHLVAAALVATVAFAAAFTLPGGYISGENDSKLNGTPILSRNTAFKAFVITDAIAMVLSTSSVFIHFTMVLLGYKQRYYWLIRSAFWFIVLAMGAMVVAFVTGTYAVLAPNSKGLAIAVCLIGLTFFLYVLYAFIRLMLGFIERDRYGNRISYLTESLSQLLRSAPRYLC